MNLVDINLYDSNQFFFSLVVQPMRAFLLFDIIYYIMLSLFIKLKHLLLINLYRRQFIVIYYVLKEIKKKKAHPNTLLLLVHQLKLKVYQDIRVNDHHAFRVGLGV